MTLCRDCRCTGPVPPVTASTFGPRNGVSDGSDGFVTSASEGSSQPARSAGSPLQMLEPWTFTTSPTREWAKTRPPDSGKRRKRMKISCHYAETITETFIESWTDVKSSTGGIAAVQRW